LPVGIASGGFIREGDNCERDHLRSSHGNFREWMAKFECDEQQRTGIKNLSIKFDGRFGYFIELTKSNISSVLAYYTHRQAIVNGQRYTRKELSEKESEILNAERSTTELESELFDKILDETRQYIPQLRETADTLTVPNGYCGWTRLAHECNYGKPIMSESEAIEIEHGRHPLVEQSFIGSRFVRNSTGLNTSDNQIAIVTGPNMASKWI
jgi:DNA mismatch repair protein MutS